jgi:transposase-like protein
MATSKLSFSEVQALYELCISGIDIKDFCAQQGVNYQQFHTWRRKQLWNDKTGKTEEAAPSTLNAVHLTDISMQMKPANNPIRYIQVKLPEGVTITRTNVSTEDIISLLTKLTAAFC